MPLHKFRVTFRQASLMSKHSRCLVIYAYSAYDAINQVRSMHGTIVGSIITKETK